MKKGIILLAGIAVFAFSSCRKDYTCTCVDSDDGYTEIYTITNVKKDDAKTLCSSHNYQGGDYSTTCTVN